MARKLVIAAVCARPYVEMACAAGYEVLALDAFADEDTSTLASQALRLPYAECGFERGAFEAALSAICREHECAGFLYGSGFEADPALLGMVSARMPLIGNAADVVARAKSVPGFFSLLAELDIPHPPTSKRSPNTKCGWLLKREGGSGGTHVRRADRSAGPGEYFQQELAGVPVSLLFAADGANVRVIGYNMQKVAASAKMPFRYGGLVSNVRLPADCCEVLRKAALTLTQTLRLRGLNSVDAVLTPDGRTFVLELNPRLTASAAAYRTHPGLLAIHLDACQGRLHDVDVEPVSQAQAVCYAREDFTVPCNLDWPAWASDLPAAGSRIVAGDPVCSVYAEAADAGVAEALAQHRLQAIAELQRQAPATVEI
ncbi:ATP-grasp domain-containing protein [Methylobacillus sp.]|uniref:ATP-grasp domain-containing protein n=1 Tax=Methylobacillus sp. TaxID=56818 RepID=UPI0012CA4918|nr:ATP-grasp domain-containing protein [Methylobacillus sp.]MPS48847.1 ATP-grasp domain-containing protein [Methylobacillus sp.]